MIGHIERAAEVIEQPKHPGYPYTTWSRPHGPSIAQALAAAGLLVTPEQRAVIDAAVAARAARITHDDTHQRVLFHGGHPNESTATRALLDDANNALADAVDALCARRGDEVTR